MRSTLLPALFALLVLPVFGSAQTVVDRLKELDRLRAAGSLSEEAYNKEWKRVLEEGIRGTSTSSNAPAVHASNPLDRQWEISFSGSWANLDAGDVDVSSTTVDLAIGRFVTNSLLIFGSANYMNADLGGDDLDTYSIGVGVDFLFGDRSTGFAPYVGAGVSWVNVDAEELGDEDDFAWDAHAGVRQYVGDRVVIKYEAGYQKYSDLDLDGFSVTVGIGLRF